MLTLAELRQWHQARHDAAKRSADKLEQEMQRRGWSQTQEKNLRALMVRATFHQAAVNAIDERDGR